MGIKMKGLVINESLYKKWLLLIFKTVHCTAFDWSGRLSLCLDPGEGALVNTLSLKYVKTI
jgi:hypothetical protein